MVRPEKKDGQGGKKYVLRQNQLFGPWGVGAILPCPDGSSVMIAGLDAFPYTPDSGGKPQMQFVSDRRLAQYIGVRKLLAPPLGASTVPAVRFPKWQYCPTCGTMYKSKGTSQVQMYCSNPSCKAKKKPRLVPERFIVVCPEGHVDDFPIMEWVHKGPVEHPEDHVITRKTRGGSASLSDIEYQCSCGLKRSLYSATNKGALEECGFTCRGTRPWLDDVQGKCEAPLGELKVVQRGGTNVWYSDVVSSIYIPDGEDKRLNDFVDEHYDELAQLQEAGVLDTGVTFLATSCTYSPKEIKSAFLEKYEDKSNPIESEGQYREIEYRSLVAMPLASRQRGVFEGSVVDVSKYASSLLVELVDSITLVTTLKETKALVGFTRLYPNANEGKKFVERRASLSRQRLDWTLGLQSTGEGIFIALSQKKIDEWAASTFAQKRLALLQRNFDNAERSLGNEPRKLNPSFLLAHVLSHVLMLGLTKECGYSAASVKERIYCCQYEADATATSMCGLLIYTASDDCEGSLGGLVRAGRPGRFERIFDRALQSACWCSSDPVCIESPGQGQNSCNLAACYSCVLTPETSCECGNRLLDRALLVGTLDEPRIGIVGEVLRDSASEEGEEHLGTLAPFAVSYEEAPDLSDESFEGACEYVLSDVLNDERDFLKGVIAISRMRKLAKPIPYVTFSRGDENAEPSLVWKDQKIALLFGESPEAFTTAFGENYEKEAEWSFLTLETVGDPERFASLIEE